VSALAAPRSATEHIAWAELGIELDTLGCPECGRPDCELVHLVACRECGCTEYDCSGCIERTGSPCYWVEPDLCSACVTEPTA